MNKRAKSNTIRIIAGQWRGRRLPVIDSEGLRPTTDRVRETVFNWLMHQVPGAHCLDLFAGTGALGLECLSRGASHVQFVEAKRQVAQQLQKNIETLGAQQSAGVAHQSASIFLRQSPAQPFDLVFLDPPFDADLLASTMSVLAENAWLAPDALIYVERSSRTAEPVLPEGWSVHKSGKAGQSAYCLYAR